MNNRPENRPASIIEPPHDFSINFTQIHVDLREFPMPNGSRSENAKAEPPH
jgi:hypothetical protein